MMQAAFTDGERLICLIKKDGQTGITLAAVQPEEERLLIQCSTGPQDAAATEAAACFQRWQWWQEEKPVHVETAHLVLQPEWTQIPVPGSIEDAVRQLKEEEAHAAEYFGYSG